MRAVGERIRERRRVLKLTATQLGARLGVSHTAVLKWEKGEAKSLRPERLSEIAEALGLPLTRLLHGVQQVSDADRELVGKNRREHVGFLVTEARARDELTQAELAEEIGVDPSVISRIESGERLPTPYQRFLIERALDIKLRPSSWDVLHAYRTGRAVPSKWPEGLLAFLCSDRGGKLGLTPIQIALLAGLSRHSDYWVPSNNDEWADLAEALLKDLGHLEFRVVPMVEPELLQQLDEKAAQASRKGGGEDATEAEKT